MALQKVESFEFPWEAEIVRSLLESEGIQAFVFDAGHVQINWAISNAVGGVRVMVNPQDLEQAEELVKAWRDGELEQVLDDEFGDQETN